MRKGEGRLDRKLLCGLGIAVLAIVSWVASLLSSERLSPNDGLSLSARGREVQSGPADLVGADQFERRDPVREAVVAEDVPLVQELATRTPQAQEAPEQERFFGRVVDLQAGQPLEGVQVFVGRERWDRAEREALAETDADGRFSLDGRLRELVDGFARPVGLLHLEGWAPKVFEVGDGASAPEQPREFHLRPGATLAGQLIGSAAGFSPELLIQFPESRVKEGPRGPYERLNWQARTRADPSGRFEFSELPAGVDLTLILIREGGVSLSYPQTLKLLRGERRRLEWDVNGPSRVVVSLLTVDGAAVPGLGVDLRPVETGARSSSQNGQRLSMTSRTDFLGVARFEGVPAGRWIATFVSGEDRPEWTSTQRELEIDGTPGETAIRLDLHPSLWIEGRVFTATGEPAKRGLVSARGKQSWAVIHIEPDGTYSLGPLLPGSYTVQANLPPGLRGPSSNPIEVEAGATGVDIHLSRVVSRTLRLLDLNQNPVESGEVGLFADEPLKGRSFEVSGSEVQIVDVPPGRYNLIATSGDLIGFFDDFYPEEGGEGATVDIQLEETGELEVHFADLGSDLERLLIVYRNDIPVSGALVRHGTPQRIRAPFGQVRIRVNGPNGDQDQFRETTATVTRGVTSTVRLEW